MLSPEDVLPLADASMRGGTSTITFRQEDVQLAPVGEAACKARVETAIFLGARVRYVVRVGQHCIRCLATDGRSFKAGETVALRVAPDRIRVLD